MCRSKVRITVLAVQCVSVCNSLPPEVVKTDRSFKRLLDVSLERFFLIL